MMNKYALGTVVGTSLLGLVKSRSGGRSIKLPIYDYIDGTPIYQPEYLEDLYELTPEEKLSIKYLQLNKTKTKTQPSIPKSLLKLSGKYTKFDAFVRGIKDENLIATEQQIRESDEYYKKHKITTLYDFFDQFNDIFIGFDNLEILSMENFGDLSSYNRSYLRDNQDPNWNRLPSSLYNLKKLYSLNIDHNNLHFIPERLSELSDLKALFVLTENPIKYIPKSLGKLKKLTLLWRCTSFHSRENPFTKPVPTQVLINLVSNGNKLGGDIEYLLRLDPPKKSKLRRR